MKSTVKANELGRALKLCVNSIDPKDPVRSNIEFIAENDTIQLKATNSSYSIFVTCPAEISEEGSAVVDGKMAYNVVSKATENCLLTADSNSMTIKTSGKTKLPNINRNIPMIDHVEGKVFGCDSIAFKNAINKVSYAIGEDQSRIILTGAHIVTNDGIMTITALDGFRLAQTEILCIGEDIDIVVPSKILNMICDAITTGELSFASNGIHFSVSGEGFSMNSIILSGQYIDTARIIPTEFKTNVLVKTSDLRNLLDSATVASGSSNLVKLIIKGESITVTSNSEDADFNGDTSALIEGDDIIIAFNLKYLIQSINHIESEKCAIRMTMPVSPAIFTDVSEGTKPDIHLILPVRVFN